MVTKMPERRGYLTEPERFPQLALLVSQAEACVAAGSLGELTRICRASFQQLLDSHELTEIIVETLQLMAQGKSAHPEWLSRTTEEWIIADTPNYSLRLVARKPRPGLLLQSLNFNCLVGNMSGPALSMIHYRFPESARIEQFEVGLQAYEEERMLLEKGSCVELLAHRDIADVVLQAPALILNLFPKVYAPLIWCFDRQSLRSVMAVASHDSPVRRQAAAEILRHIHQSEDLPVEASLETLGALTRDSAYFVRWAALQGLCAIDLDHARSYLISAARDPHPAVAAAARRAISTHLDRSEED